MYSQSVNIHDSNSNFIVDVNDLLNLLGYFGDVDSDQDGIWDSADNCIDTQACNYLEIIPSVDCVYIDALGVCGGSCEDDCDNDGICNDDSPCIIGCTDSNFIEYNPDASIDDGSCQIEVVFGCIDEFYLEYNSNSNTDDGSCINLIIYGCTLSEYEEFNILANVDDGTCFTYYGCIDDSFDEYNPLATVDDGTCSTYYGCTDDSFDEYNLLATVDDGTCSTYYGCTDDGFDEYNPLATVDDGTCSTYYGCTDDGFYEYNPLATVDDGTCLTDAVFGCIDINYDEYNPAANVDDGSCLGFTCGSPFIFNAIYYNTKEVFGECWFTENLQTETYLNGDSIPSQISDNNWINLNLGAYAIYGEGDSDCSNSFTYYYNEEYNAYIPASNDECEIETIEDIWGYLYNGYAVIDDRGLCPSGWHVSSWDDWSELISSSWIDYDPSTLLSYQGWADGNGSTFGFNITPSGLRSIGGGFTGAGTKSYIWAPNNNCTSECTKVICNYDSILLNVNSSDNYGYSVRCVKD